MVSIDSNWWNNVNGHVGITQYRQNTSAYQQGLQFHVTLALSGSLLDKLSNTHANYLLNPNASIAYRLHHAKMKRCAAADTGTDAHFTVCRGAAGATGVDVVSDHSWGLESDRDGHPVEHL